MIPDKVNDFKTKDDAQEYLDNIPNKIAEHGGYTLASADVTASRQAVCQTCDRRGSVFDVLHYCTECTCFIEINTLMQKSICPLDKWAE